MRKSYEKCKTWFKFDQLVCLFACDKNDITSVSNVAEIEEFFVLYILIENKLYANVCNL